MTETQSWTIKRLLDWTTEHFTKKGFESARLDAEVLLAEALNCQRIQLYTRFDQVPEESRLAMYRDWVVRRAKGEPVAYLVGHKEFYSLRFKVDSNVLIPRPETEHLIVKAVDLAGQFPKPCSIIDVGTGSGCIAVTLATHITDCTIVATDISPDAINVAVENATKHEVQERIEFIQGDLLEAVADNRKFDLIVSNPPYIGTDEEGTVDESVRKYEPEIALFSGSDGTDVIRRLVQQSTTRLEAGGFLVFETSPIIFDACLEIVNETNSFTDVETIKDYSDHRRIVFCTASVNRISSAH